MFEPPFLQAFLFAKFSWYFHYITAKFSCQYILQSFVGIFLSALKFS